MDFGSPKKGTTMETMGRIWVCWLRGRLELRRCEETQQPGFCFRMLGVRTVAGHWLDG